MPTVDLGCGFCKRGDIGIDISPLSSADILCNLGFDPIPLEDNSIDGVSACHFIEHLPQYVYYREDGQWKMHTPIIFLFNEVYRILKMGGTFDIRVPKWDCQEMYQDPTHKSVWVPNAFQYFHEDCFDGLSKTYGVTSRFRVIKYEIEPAIPFAMHIILVKE